ncbi:ARM repeat-containing protein [Cristinia sonorae]|uniref:ARM repeat-containing protein n=1 Tax=Cristinia sonorae TaxID=1940300 RepID=A0A8K0UKD1_9AGAR|nr:ARM repeat-containing protein [Cristinia sonorae]
MDPTLTQQPYVPLFDAPSSRNSMAASIWAPQPQPSETAWSRAIDSINRADHGHSNGARPDPRRTFSFPANKGGEDVFGPLGFVGNRKKDVGAIGDGRRKNSYYDVMHVEQLLRPLNLDSPGPYNSNAHSGDFISSPTSPDLSPISTTSALLTPTDLSPAKGFDHKHGPAFDFSTAYQAQPNGLLFETGISQRYHEITSGDVVPVQHADRFQQSDAGPFPLFEPFSERPTPAPSSQTFPSMHQSAAHPRRESAPTSPFSWGSQRFRTSSEWVRPDERRVDPITTHEQSLPPFSGSAPQGPTNGHEPINFLSLLHPSSAPPYALFVSRIIKSSDQQASIFLQQKLKVADTEERGKIVDAICSRGYEMMAHRFGNWAVQRCLEATASVEERRKIVGCMRGRVVDLATNCYGCHVLQKALDCEEDIRLIIVSELLLGDPAQTLVNKHASHVWSKIMELTWTPPAPPIFAYVNRSLQGKWASLACHETGSLVVQHAFENLEESAKDGIVDELLNHGPAVFGEVAKNQWGSYCIQHILEHGSNKHRSMALDHLVSGLLEYATSEQGAKSVTKALKEGGKDTLVRIIKRMCEPAKGARRAMIVDLALSATGSQLIAAVLPNADKDQRALLYDSIRGHIVTLRGCKTGSKVIWLFDRMRAYYGY